MVQKILFTVLLSQFCLFGIAQEKLLKEAISRGPSADGVYCINNSKKANVTLDEMRSYVKQAGYIPTNGTTQQISRYGSPYIVVKTLEFTDPNNFDGYIFSQLNGSGNVSFNQLKSKGCCFVPFVEAKGGDNAIWSGYVQDGRYKCLRAYVRYDNVLWSGSVVDGLLDGSGVGLYVNGEGRYTWLSGTFEHGLATSAINIKKAKRNDSEEKRYSNYSEAKSEVFTRPYCDMALNVQDAQLLQALSWYYRPYYSESVAKMEAACNRAQPLTISNYANYKLDGDIEEFYNIYSRTNYDPQNKLPKAREFYGTKQVVTALNLEFKQYIANSALGYVDVSGKDRETLKTAIEIAKKYANSSQYGFKNFFAQAGPKLDSKYAAFEQKIQGEWDSEAEFQQRVRNRIANSSTEIDTNNCKEPSGKLVNTSMLSSYKTYEKDGIIRTKGGERVDYNIIYKPNNEIDCYRINYASQRISNKLNGKRDFRTRDEMIGAIVNDLK